MRASLPRPLSLGLFLLFSLLLCGLNIRATAQSGGVTVANFSFESPTISNYDEAENGYTMRQAGQNPVWTITDYAGIGLAEYFNKDASGHGQAAPDGNQVGYVQSYYGIGSSIAQSVSGLQAGQSYYVIVAAAQAGGNTGGTPLPVQVSLGAQSYTFTPTGTNYRDYTFGPFTGSAGSQALRFATVTQSTSVAADVMLDNVRVVPASSVFAAAPGVPVPNFSFEAPTISSYYEFQDGYAMMQAHTNVGWTLSAYSGIGLAECFNKDEPGRGQLAPDGSQVAYVQSYYSYAPGTISQAVSGFQPGQSYYLIVSAAQGGGNTGGTLLPVVASLGGQTFMFTPSGTQYQDYTFGPVTASAASQTVGFMAVPQSASTAATAMLDNVRVVLSASPSTPAVLSLYPATIPAGSSSLGTVTLSSYAPPAGVVVTLASSSPAATVPASVTVPGGQRSATFPVSTADVNAATTATVSATAGGVTQTATLTITPSLSLTAAATGSNKVTLYWNGISGASGYNVYRGTASGGPYSLITSNVTTSDAGPGMTNAFMYSDAAGLVSGTEYFYIVWAVQSGAQTVQSNEDSAVPNANAIPWDTGDAAQIVPSMVSLLASTLPPDDFSDPTPPDVGFLSIGGPDGVIYQGNIPTGSAPRAVASSGRYNASNNTIDYVDGTTLAAPSDGDDAINGQASAAPTGAIKPNVVQNVPVYQYPAYTPTPTGIFHKVETQPGYSGFRGIVGLPLPGDTGLVLNKSGTEQDMAYIYTGGLLFPTAGQKYRNGATLDMDIGLQLGHSDPVTNPGWKPIILYKGSALESEIVDGSSPASGESVFIKGDSLDGERMFLYTSGVLASGATTSAQSAATDNLVVLRLVGPYVYRKQITPGFNTDRSYNGAVTCTFFASGWGKFYPRNGPQAPLVPKRFIIKRCNSIAQTLNNPRTPAIFKTGRVYPNGPPGVPRNQAGFYTSGSSIIGASWGTADNQAVTVYGPSGWESWEDPQTWVDSLGLTHSGSYPALNRYVDWLDQNDFFWEVNVNLQTRP